MSDQLGLKVGPGSVSFLPHCKGGWGPLAGSWKKATTFFHLEHFGAELFLCPAVLNPGRGVSL